MPSDLVGDYRRLCRLILEPLRARWGVCSVVSGYRHPSYNRVVGGARRSVHMGGRGGGIRGVAADVRFARGGPMEWYDHAHRLLIERYPPGGGLGRYPGPTGWVHIDTRSYAARWTGAG